MSDSQLLTRHGQLFALLLVTLLAGALRFYRLGDWSYWRDETYTLLGSLDLASTNPNYPLWYVITHLSISKLGVSEWSARLPAALVGTLAIPLTYVLLRRAGGGLSALIAALLLAVSPWHLYWSQNARFYLLLSLLTSLGLLVFYLGLEGNRLSYLVAALLLFGLSVLTHPTALLMFAVLAAYLLALARLDRARPTGLNRRNLAILAAMVGFPALFLAWRVVAKPTSWTQFLGWSTNDYLWLPSAAVYYLGVPLICMAVVGIVYSLARRDRLAILLTLAAVLPPAALVLVSSFSFTASRYLFVAAVPWIILAARGAGELVSQLRGDAKWLGVGVIATLALQPLSEDFLYYRYQNGNRNDYRGAYRIVQQQMQPEDLVLSNAPEMGPFFLSRTTVLSVQDTNLAAVVQERRRAWYVTDMPPEELDRRVAVWVSRYTTLVANLDVHVRARNYAMRVYLFDPTRPRDKVASDAAQTEPSPPH